LNKNATMSSRHRKRNFGIVTLAIFGVAILAFCVFLQLDFAYHQPINVEYNLNIPNRFSSNQTNSFDLTYINHEEAREANFYLTVSVTNASLSPQTSQPDAQGTDKSAKFLLLLQRSDSVSSSATKTIAFVIDEGAAGFSVNFKLSEYLSNPLPSYNYPFTRSIEYQWNQTSNSYEQPIRTVIIA
jgi:hypothetical protein